MFSRWTFVRQKTVERALQTGRLDEAFERLAALLNGGGPPAQRLVAQLAEALRARARVAAQGGRYDEALRDLDRVRQLRAEDADALELRERILAEQNQRRARHATDREAVQRASEQLQAGRLDSGRAAIERIEDAGRRERLREELDIRVQRSEDLLEQARDALARHDVLGAARLWEETIARHGRTRGGDEFSAVLLPHYRDALQGALREGRLDAFRAMLAATPAMRRQYAELAEFDQIAALLERAAQQLEQLEPGGLRATLTRLTGLCGDPGWMKSALEAVESAFTAHHALLACPLGRIAPSIEKPPQIGTPTVANSPGRAPQEAGPGEFASPLLLLVDGGGSSLLLGGERIRIGRAGGVDVDVPLPADIHSRHAEIVYNGEDYFLVAHAPTRVNQRSISRALLRDGDRIVLGGVAKMVFERPSAKTDSAALRLSDRNRLAQDVGRVVLFRGACSIGAQPSCHIRVRDAEGRLTLFERDGKLFVRRMTPEGRPEGRATPAPLMATIESGDLRLTLKKYA